MKLDLRGWQKVKHAADHSVLRNKEGHELRISHKALNPKQRGQIAELPVAMAQGGDPAAEDDAQAPPAPAATPGQPITINVGAAPPSAIPAQPIPQADGSQPFGTAPAQFGTGAPIAQAPPTMPDNSIAPPPEAPAPQAAQDAPVAAPSAPNGQAPASGSQGADPFGNTAQYNDLSKGINQEVAGIQGQAAAESRASRDQAAALQQQITSQQRFMADNQKHYAALEAERQAFQKDQIEHKIDPNRYLGSMDTAQRIQTTIGVILGGIGGALTHQSNPVLGYINQQIDRDIAAQRADLDKGQNLLSANLRQFGNLRDAADMTRVMMADTVNNQLKLAAAKSGDQAAQARALQAQGALNQKYAPIIGQIAARQSLLNGVKAGTIEPSTYIRAIVPESEKAGVAKEVQEAQNLSAVRDNALSAIDQLTKIDSLGNRILNPIQASRQIGALKGPTLDKLTKDVSGRVTPETVKLVGSAFDKMLANPETIAVQRQAINNLLTENMHFPLAEQYIPREVLLKGRFGGAQGQPTFKEMPPVLPKR